MREEIREGSEKGWLESDSLRRILDNLLELQRLRRKRVFWNVVILGIGTAILAGAFYLVTSGTVGSLFGALYCAYFVYSMGQSIKILWDIRKDYRADQDLVDFLEEKLSFRA